MIWSWYVLLLIPVAWFIQNMLHEGSHLLFGWFYEGRIPTGFYPWPHKYKGRFFFARYSSGPPSKNTGYLKSEKPRHIAPFIIGMVVLTICLICIFVTPAAISLYFVPFAIASLIDCLFFWYTYLWGSKWSDGKRFKAQ